MTLVIIQLFIRWLEGRPNLLKKSLTKANVRKKNLQEKAKAIAKERTKLEQEQAELTRQRDVSRSR